MADLNLISVFLVGCLAILLAILLAVALHMSKRQGDFHSAYVNDLLGVTSRLQGELNVSKKKVISCALLVERLQSDIKTLVGENSRLYDLVHCTTMDCIKEKDVLQAEYDHLVEENSRLYDLAYSSEKKQ